MNKDRQQETRAVAYAEHLRERFGCGILAELQPYPQWVVWKPETMQGKVKKVPYNPATHRYASVKQPDTWGSLENALNALTTGNYSGIGFMLTEQDPICGIDLDHSRDPHTGQLTPLAKALIATLNSYTETSPSKTGIHILTQATLPGRGIHTDVEMYDRGRFFTITTNHLEGTPTAILARQAEVASLYAQYAPVQSPTRRLESTRVGGGVARRRSLPRETGRLSARSDEEVLELAQNARNREQFVELWDGKWQGNPRYTSQGRSDESKADWQLVKYLLYWIGNDPVQTDRLFRRSGLMREKWDDNVNSGGSGYTYGCKWKISLAAAPKLPSD